jgi:NAD(P)-dependent dehydrogenase (short-subunit alcohol dehydrogenase family)
MLTPPVTDISSLTVTLDGRLAAITGGASGIGRAIAELYTRFGARVMIIDADADAAATVAAGLDGAAAYSCDVTSTASVAEAVEAIWSQAGPIDILVNSAGVARLAPAESLDDAQWSSTIAVNLTGTYFMCREVGRRMIDRGSGKIINLASQAASVALPEHVAYCASKFGVVGFTRALMAELKGQVGVTLVTPGGMSTAFFDDRSPQYQPAPGAPLADPCDVASAIVFALCQPPGCEVKELVVAGPEETSWP